MTEMLDTSLEAYKAISKTDKQEKVLAILNGKRPLCQPPCTCQPRSLCNYQIALFSGWPINCITGRIKELRKKGLVVKDGDKRPGPPTNKLNVSYWKAVKAETLF